MEWVKEFVEEYKATKKRMNWKTCIDEGRNADYLGSLIQNKTLNNLAYSILLEEAKYEMNLALKPSSSKVLNLVGGATTSMFEDFFRKHYTTKLEIAKNPKSSIATGMTDQMNNLYDRIVEKTNEGFLCLENVSKISQSKLPS
ncbi:hypothetical protein INT48_009622 [Thamnidium elegans]|uniref:Uncharacterized protein n=1 Tax=Thamnidium elegans TaxID=101142 RepID=A0A8H7W3Y8_9FUNG|nr:hypothetical protein INT48_009622 [Thamnidium elegans]